MCLKVSRSLTIVESLIIVQDDKTSKINKRISEKYTE